MFQQGEWIIYGSTGVCRVEGVGTPEWAPAGEGKLYYRLAPAFDTGVILIPVDSPVFMRPILTRSQAQELIDRIPQICAEQSVRCEARELAEHYRAFFQSHRCEDLVQLIKTIYQKGQALARQGKKPGKTDLQFRKRAEQLLHGELAVALGIPLDQVPAYIQQRLQPGGES